MVSKLINDALFQYQTVKDINGIVRGFTSLGELYELNGNTAGALQYYAKAEKLNQGKPVSDEYFSLINSIGKLHNKLGNHRKAANYFEKGVRESKENKHVKAHVAFLNQAGQTYSTFGNKTQALAYHQQALQTSRKNKLHDEEARSLMNIAHVIKSRNADQSIIHLKNALAIARAIGHHQLSAEIYSSLSDIYRQQARYEDALIALEEHHRLLDSLLTMNEGHKIAAIQSSYELAESKLHIESLELTNQRRTNQRNLGLLVTLAMVIMLAVLAFDFYKTNRLNKRLTTSNQIKDKLFSIIGHDLRNPIGGITQLLALLEDGDLTAEESRQMISEMRKQGNVTLEILNALLSWGEAQLNGIHIKPSRFHAKASIEKNIVALSQVAEAKLIIINDHTPFDLTVYGDINHFEFIIRNLLSNAIKFSHPSGTIEINAGLDTHSGETFFSVQDNGKGISKVQQEQFLKANLDIAYGTKGEKGTGIGLMLSKEFVKANQGKIWLESKEGQGSTFYFFFHLPEPTGDVRKSSRQLGELQVKNHRPEFSYNKITIVQKLIRRLTVNTYQLRKKNP